MKNLILTLLFLILNQITFGQGGLNNSNCLLSEFNELKSIQSNGYVRLKDRFGGDSLYVKFDSNQRVQTYSKVFGENNDTIIDITFSNEIITTFTISLNPKLGNERAFLYLCFIDPVNPRLIFERITYRDGNNNVVLVTKENKKIGRYKVKSRLTFKIMEISFISKTKKEFHEFSCEYCLNTLNYKIWN